MPGSRGIVGVVGVVGVGLMLVVDPALHGLVVLLARLGAEPPAEGTAMGVGIGV